MNICSYYQAKVVKEVTWFFVATFRSNEHIAFDRTVDVENGVFEFLVPEGQEKEFLQIMQGYLQINLINNFVKLPNRLV